MALTIEETPTELTYDMPGTRLIVVKDDTVVDVRQITQRANANGQTWESLRDYLATKIG